MKNRLKIVRQDATKRIRQLYNEGFTFKSISVQVKKPVSKIIEALEIKDRKCLKCERKFKPEGRFLFTCPSCRKSNSGVDGVGRFITNYAKSRGKKAQE